MNICELLENSDTQLNENENEAPLVEEPMNLKKDTLILSGVPTQNCESSSDSIGTDNKNDHLDQISNENSSDETEQNPEEQTNMNAESSSSSSSSTEAVDDDNNDEDNSDYNKNNQDSSDSQNNIDFGHSILSSNSSVDDEFNFDRLGPFEKLCSLCDNPTPSNMESASKYLVPALEFCSTQEDYMRVFSYLRKYCFFSDVLLRSLWLEQIQNIIQYIHQESDNIPVEFKDNFNMPNELALLISDLMQEPTYQVKKYATASLLCIVERQLLNNEQIEKIIIPSLLNLVKENNEDFHIDCVSLFGKLAPLIGPDLTAKYFLDPFCRLSTSPVFHTRKACASNITEIANVVTTEEVEKYLIPHFCEFMKDQVWAIRKVCADIFSIFALKCRRKTREQVLTEYFIRLLDDNSRWVKISAYKSLGSFIATFSKDNLKNDETEEEVEKIEETMTKKSTDESSSEFQDDAPMSNSQESESLEASDSDNKETEYSNFIYWRNSLPSLDSPESKACEELKSEPNESQNTKTVSSTSTLATDTKTNTIEPIQINSKSTSQFVVGSGYSNLYSSTNSLYNTLQQQQQTNNANAKPTDLNQLSDELKQDVVPSILLSYFITMVDMNAQNSLDAEMNYNCAFNFPAIALTLGLANWKYVKDLYKKLSEDNNWKVRQTLAYSIHELALILGTECTQTELVPVFDSFIKDVDEVRMGIVSNLSKFLSVLSLEYRVAYMPKLNDFLRMDNVRNWRFRNELGLQIAEFCDLFPTNCIAEYIQPVSFLLALDKVAEVRVTSLKALTVILKQFEIHNEKKYRREFLNDVIGTFATNNRWVFRQMFVFLCENIFKEKAYGDLDELSNDILPKLFSMRDDVVANIRVCLARVVTSYILNIEYFTNCTNPISTELDITIEQLNKDKESDVRMFFHFEEPAEKTSLPAYEEAINFSNENKENINTALTTSGNSSHLQDYDISSNNDRLNDSLNLISAQTISYGSNEDVEIEEEDDDDDDDEIIDTTKVGQLKIVNEIDNDMEDDSDEIIDTSPISRLKEQTKSTTENLNSLKNHLDRTKINEISTTPIIPVENDDATSNSKENS